MRNIITITISVIITSESRMALTGVAIVTIHTGAAVLAWTGLALILFLLTVLPHPASFTVTVEPLDKIKTCTGLKCGISCIVKTAGFYLDYNFIICT